MIQLTDKEKAEIIERIQNDKPLPAKYRATLFEDAKGVELIWKGKRNEVTNVVLPFQTIEQIDEPRDESHRPEYVDDLWSDPKTGRQVGGWTNKLIWGDNKLVLSSLKNGPMRREIENAGGLKLIYIDPPFDTGADFSFNVEVGDGESVTKQPSVLEEIAYRDTWGENGERYLQYIYERLILMRDLLHPAGSIYVHCDWRLNCHIRILLEEILGKFNLINQISWKRYAAHNLSQKRYDAITDTIIAFAVDWPENIFTPQFGITQECEMESRFPHIEAETGRRYQHVALEQASNASSKGEARYIAGRRVVSEVGWRWSQETFDERLRENPNLIHWTKAGRPRYKLYVDEYEGSPLGDIWTDIGYLSANDSQGVGYPTQKPEALLERIIKASSNEGDLVADFFCGSGTTLAVAEKLGRKWIGCDLGRFAIHTSRKRLIGVQRRLKAEGKPYRSFEILNLGKYERQYFVGINLSLPETEREKESRKKETEYVRLVLEAYKAQPVSQSPPFHGRKGKVMIVVGPIDAPVTQALVDEVVNGCLAQGLKMVDVLGFDFEMGLVPQAQNEASKKGVHLALKYIPKEVFDREAVRKGHVKFYDAGYLDAALKVLPENKVTITLKGYSIFYQQDADPETLSSLKTGASKVIVENGKVVRVSKDAKGEISKEILTKQWTDWVDYWAVDFNYESRKEIIRVVERNTLQDSHPSPLPEGDKGNTENGIEVEKWTGGYIFENEWQSFRTRKDRTLELTSSPHQYPKKGKYKIAVKVIDLFGNDTTKVLEVKI